MGKTATFGVLFLIVLCYGVLTTAIGLNEEEKYRREEWEGRREEWFLLQDTKHVVKTDAGEMRVVRSLDTSIVDRQVHIGFITMEPKTLFIPQYIDSGLIIFIRRGEAKLGLIYKDRLVERRLRSGDIYQIQAGSTFYLVNTGVGQRLHIICSIDPSESLGVGVFQSFFIGGGTNPSSILSGFDPELLASAFNVSAAVVKSFLTKQREGPIVYVSDSHAPSLWTKFLELREEERLQQLKKMVDFQEEHDDDEEEDEEGRGKEKEDDQPNWSWRKLLNSIFGNENKKSDDKVTGKSPDSYNLYDKKPDFRNNYGWSLALDANNYKPLKRSGIGLYLVNLTAGSMMAPHVNPRATEYGVVLRGTGRIQIVYPNGSSAMDAEVREGDVFWIPRYFPFCQIASRTQPLEFFGFTTSARKNRPQFLVGASSILQSLRGPELAAAFGISEERMGRLIDAQREGIILPTARAAPPDGEMKGKVKELKMERMPGVIKNLGDEMIMGFD